MPFDEHRAATRHVYNAMIHVVNKDKWDALTPNQQRISREESAAAGALMRSAVQAQEAEEVAGLIERGMKVTIPDLAPFAAKMGDARARVADYSGQENMDKFLEFLD